MVAAGHHRKAQKSRIGCEQSLDPASIDAATYFATVGALSVGPDSRLQSDEVERMHCPLYGESREHLSP
jgi:hypothetical protein